MTDGRGSGSGSELESELESGSGSAEAFRLLDAASARARLGELQARYEGGSGSQDNTNTVLAIVLALASLTMAAFVVANSLDTPAVLILLAMPALIGWVASYVWRHRRDDSRVWFQLRQGGLAYRQAMGAAVAVPWSDLEDIDCALTTTRINGVAAGTISSLTVSSRHGRLDLDSGGDRLAALGDLLLRAAVPVVLEQMRESVSRGGSATYLPLVNKPRGVAWVADRHGLSGPEGTVAWREVTGVQPQRTRLDIHLRGERKARLSMPLTGGSSRSAAFAALVQDLAAHPG